MTCVSTRGPRPVLSQCTGTSEPTAAFEGQKSSLTRAQILKFMALEYKLSGSLLFIVAFKKWAIKFIIYETFQYDLDYISFTFLYFITSEQSLYTITVTSKFTPPSTHSDSFLIPTAEKSTHQEQTSLSSDWNAV